MTVEKEFLVILKSGSEFEHRPISYSEEEWWEFVAEIINKMNQKDVLVTQNPYAAYRMEDISGFQFGDAAPPDVNKPIGFRTG